MSRPGGEVRLGQGREQAKRFLADNADLAEEIRKAILAKGLLAVDGPAPAAPAPAADAGAAGEEASA